MWQQLSALTFLTQLRYLVGLSPRGPGKQGGTGRHTGSQKTAAHTPSCMQVCLGVGGRKNYLPWCYTGNILCIWCKPWTNAIRNHFSESEESYHERNKWTMSVNTMEFQKDYILVYHLITLVAFLCKIIFYNIWTYKTVFHHDYKQNLASLPFPLISCQRQK